MYWTNKFVELNNKYWDGELTNISVVVRDLSSESAEGLYHFPEYVEDEDGESYIIEEALIEIDSKLSHHQKINILLHEMCHHAVEEFYEERPYHDHGKWWKQEMVRCGFKGKIHPRRGLYKTKNL